MFKCQVRPKNMKSLSFFTGKYRAKKLSTHKPSYFFFFNDFNKLEAIISLHTFGFTLHLSSFKQTQKT